MKNLVTLCRTCHDKTECGEDVFNVDVNPDVGTHWQEWVYGGASKPEDKHQRVTADKVLKRLIDRPSTLL